MHGFWRGAIAILIVYGLGIIWAGYGYSLYTDLYVAINTLLRGGAGPSRGLIFGIVLATVWYLPFAVLALVMYGGLTRIYGPRAIVDNETRCRQCRYILRGITEPRCPECGHAI